jgi:DNA polymerase II large subunit
MGEGDYLKIISDEVLRQYEIIGAIKQIKIPVAADVGARIEGLLSVLNPKLIDSGLADFIREAEKKYSPNDWRVALDAAIATAHSKFIKFENQYDAIEMGIRVGLAYITSAIVSAPLEGFVRAEFKKRKDGQEYIACHFGGPIRGAGGTAAASVLVIADTLRAEFGLGKYDPNESEIGRVKVEVTDYNEYEARLQYIPDINEIDFLIRNLPIEIEGDPTTDREVSAYKNLPRIGTNRIRGGMCLVLCEGFAQKAAKVQKMVKSFGEAYKINEDFNFLSAYLKLKELEHAEAGKKENQNGNGGKVLPNYRYLEELAAGRPVFSYPLRSGGFRLRYGRGRVSGFAAASINPATNIVMSSFVATGSQLRVELPGKACAITPCSVIEGPIVKLRDGTVKKLNTKKDAEATVKDISEILYLGDILFNYGDFSEQGHLFMPSPFVEEWWKAIVSSKGETIEKESGSLGSFEDNLAFSKKHKIPLHPKFLYFWTQISTDQLYGLIEAIYTKGKVEIQEKIIGKNSKLLILPNEQKVKRTMELLGVEHKVITDIIVEDADALLGTIGYPKFDFEKAASLFTGENDNLKILGGLSGVEIRDYAGTFIGGRLGRPEKAKMREMETNPNVIFPVGAGGGPSRNIVAAAEKGLIEAEYGIFFCDKCNKETIYATCPVCGSQAQRFFYCRVCMSRTKEKVHHAKETVSKMKIKINIKDYLERAFQGLDIKERPQTIKGVRGVFNSSGAIEPLEKGIIRSILELNVNKDGTIRFDAIEVPITHFKPKEVETSIERLRELGYNKDVYGKTLEDPEQIVQLKSQDIILPTYGGPDENGAEVMVRVSKFVDELLLKYYKKEPIMNVSSKQDLIGKLVVGLAPHTSCGIIGRIIGFSKTQGLFAHPFFHAAMRRNCDGDEASLILLSDMLLNFNRELLPDTRGARYMDSPLVLSIKLDLNSVDSEVYNLDIVDRYPVEFYEATLSYSKPADVKIKQVKNILDKPDSTILFTHDTDNINEGINVSAYKTLETMQEKVVSQMDLEEKLRAVDLSDIARIIIDKHFIKDIKGNLRRFGTQEFRCVKCNERYRRMPLIGKCTKCHGNVILTSSEGNIKKYLYLSMEIANKYNVQNYLKNELALLKSEIDTIFGITVSKQVSLSAFN